MASGVSFTVICVSKSGSQFSDGMKLVEMIIFCTRAPLNFFECLIIINMSFLNFSSGSELSAKFVE